VLYLTAVLADGISHWPMDDALGLGVKPLQIVFVSDKSFIAFCPLRGMRGGRPHELIAIGGAAATS